MKMLTEQNLKLDTLNHSQRAVFGRSVFGKVLIPFWAVRKIVEVR